MNNLFARRSLGAVLALILILSALPLSALAAQSENAEFTLIELKGTDVTLDETVFEYTGNPILPNVTVRVEDRLLTLDQDYTLAYADNIEPGTGKVIVTGIATAAPSYGFTGTVEIPFTINAIPEETYPLVEITAENVKLEGTEFTYTGKAIEPKVTVTVEGKVLTLGKDYSLAYTNNIRPGTALVTVAGIATEAGGYTGVVEVPFTIVPMTEENYPLVEIKGTDVTIEGTKFFYTGKEIKPAVTVQVNGKVLTAGKDYDLKYENNVNVGTATVTVSGIATATEVGGYTGQVKIPFTIVPRYQVTQGSGAVWTQGSDKTLTFTANGEAKDFAYLSINGKTVDTKHYTVKAGSTVLTLKNSFLKILNPGSYTVTFHYPDGEASGTFQVVKAVDTTNPQTGDGFPLHAATAVLFISLTGILGAAFAWKKNLF